MSETSQQETAAAYLAHQEQLLNSGEALHGEVLNNLPRSFFAIAVGNPVRIGASIQHLAALNEARSTAAACAAQDLALGVIALAEKRDREPSTALTGATIRLWRQLAGFLLNGLGEHRPDAWVGGVIRIEGLEQLLDQALSRGLEVLRASGQHDIDIDEAVINRITRMLHASCDRAIKRAVAMPKPGD